MNSAVRRRRGTSLLLAAALLAGGASQASGKTLERMIPASYKLVTHVQAEGESTRCIAEYQIVISPVRGATSYRASYYDDYYKRQERKSGPPFEHFSPGGTPDGKTAWGLTGISQPGGCPSAADYAQRFPRPPVAYAIFDLEDDERLIDGAVRLDCSGESSCPKAPGVPGVTITAAGRTTKTIDDGRYLLKVRKGRHTVRAQGGPLRITTAERRIDLRRRTTATADFKACGLRQTTGLRTVTGGTWIGGRPTGCLNYTDIRWRGSSNSLQLSWLSAPTCARGIGQPRILADGLALTPGQEGHGLTVDPATVKFFYPLRPPGSLEPGFIRGTLNADGTGVANGKYLNADCTYDMRNLKLKRR